MALVKHRLDQNYSIEEKFQQDVHQLGNARLDRLEELLLQERQDRQREFSKIKQSILTELSCTRAMIENERAENERERQEQKVEAEFRRRENELDMTLSQQNEELQALMAENQSKSSSFLATEDTIPLLDLFQTIREK